MPPDHGHGVAGRAQRVRRGEPAGAPPTAKTRGQLGRSTGKACGWAEIDRGERDKQLPRRWKHLGPVLQLHEREGNMR
jgi:hypothetical protein